LLKFVVRRLLALPVVILIVTVILFLLLMQLPAERRVMVYIPSVNPHLTDEQYEDLVQHQIERYGLDRPVHVQYIRWMRELATSEWGYSPVWRESVLDGLRRRAPITLELVLYAAIPAALLSITAGSMAARRKGRLPDHAIQAATFVAWAFPPFILALILMNVFYAWLGWFPPERYSVWAGLVINSEAYQVYTRLLTVDALLNGRFDLLVDALRHLVLPSVTLAVVVWALLTRIMRASLLEVLRQDYVTTARAKGVPEGLVVRRHARRNAILPFISAGGAVTSLLITGVVVVEVVFNINGVGRWAITAILETDVPVAVGFALSSCIVVVLASLFADVLYALVDPRIRLEA
jgi:peptide/nickel transport system permease protein